jgi:cell division protease FtsH
VSRLLRQAEVRAVDLLRSHRDELDGLVNLLLDKETVDGGDVYRLTGRPDRSQSTSPMQPPVSVAPHAAVGGGSGAASADRATPDGDGSGVDG